LAHKGSAVLRGTYERDIGRDSVIFWPVRGFRSSELHGVPVTDNRVEIRHRSAGREIRVTQGARRVRRVFELREFSDIAGRRRRRFGDRL